MPVVNLTDRFVKTCKPLPGQKRTPYFDEITKGLELLVSESGNRVWFYHFTLAGMRERLKLGTYPATSLAGARGRAIEAAGHVEAKRDPGAAFEAESTEGMTVAGLFEEYLKHLPTAGKGPRLGLPLKSAPAIERRLARNVTPIIGGVRLADLHKRDVTSVINPMKARAPTEAARTFEDVRAMVRWGVSQGYLDTNPIDGMKKPAGSQPRETRLTPDEIRALWHGLPKALAKSIAVQRIIKLLLLTAQRVGEVSGMQRGELDLKANVWTIPADRSKNAYAHKVPLTDAAVAIIKEAIADAGEDSEFVFPSPASEEPGSLPGHAVAKTITRANVATEENPNGRFGIAQQWTAHDLRRTAVSEMAELGIAPIILGHVINHRSVTRAGVTLAVYSQYDYAKEKREALNAWAARLDGIIGSAATVIPMRKKPKRA